LPPHLQYLRPIARDIKIDLEKLNSLIKDPAVKVIKCDGPDEHIFVSGSMGVKPTNTILSREEIDNVIKKFSEISKIPVQEGIYSVVVGRLILSAIISEVVGSKFMIKKMLYTPNFQNQTYPQPMIR
jgi:type IV secretory pathway ATPase VirB11/archaellum biosynthesis ATPase